ncbi:hypothetical protein GpartN1_g6419.t1 [Galdieria partita]|uniref:Uncharacterized protein n=1 Tax=Galdieria partita TaxID=83374 RepID=A0A9C7Q192_9RHOD|nr:hypothetical protein GpartN1_g6419.t1 [Galdieria partita]
MLQPLVYGRKEQHWTTPRQQQVQTTLLKDEGQDSVKKVPSSFVTLKGIYFQCCHYVTQFLGYSLFACDKFEKLSQSAKEYCQKAGSELYGKSSPDWKPEFSQRASPTRTDSGFCYYRLRNDKSLRPLVAPTASNANISRCFKGNIEDSDHSSSFPERQNVQYNKKTEISFERILELGSFRFVNNTETYSEEHPYNGPPLLTMSCLGELGRFGNQLFQYMFLRCCAFVHQTSVQVPSWIGESLFDLKDDGISVKLPLAVESSRMKANSIFTDKLIEYIKSTSTDKQFIEIEPDVLEGDSMKKLVNVDIWGWFQWHTKYYRPFRSYIYSLFRVKPDLKEYLDVEINKKLCPLDGSVTLVGIHIRLGDYKDIAGSSFAYCAPVSWYIEWLEYIWPQLENPVLFVASDEIDQVEKYFWEYQPKTCYSLGIHMPKTYASVEADFFPDWYILTMCDVLAISNSTFSFTSCLLNQKKEPRFYRAHFLYRIIEMDPWNTNPIIHKELSFSFWKRTWDTLLLLYRQQGTVALLRNLFWGIPLYRIRSLLIDVVLGLRRLYWNSFLRKWFYSK